MRICETDPDSEITIEDYPDMYEMMLAEIECGNMNDAFDLHAICCAILKEHIAA
jgi:hypothetical protein